MTEAGIMPAAFIGQGSPMNTLELTATGLDVPADLPKLVGHDDFEHAVPTPEHFIPLLCTAGLAAATDTTPEVLIEGFAYGSLSMTCFTVGAECPVDRAGEGVLAGAVRRRRAHHPQRRSTDMSGHASQGRKQSKTEDRATAGLTDALTPEETPVLLIDEPVG